MSYTELTVWTRGIIMDKEGRDIVNSVSAAARKEGKYSGQDLFPTGNWRAIRPVYRDKLPPCNNASGTNEKIQGYLDLVKRGKYLDAYALIKEDMPFPSVTGRVCYHPCAQGCIAAQPVSRASVFLGPVFHADLFRQRRHAA